MKKHVLFLFATLLSLVASAQTKVEIDGIWYNLITKGKVAEVTYQGDSYWDYDEYSGSVTLPVTVTHNGVTYSVTSIGDYAFSKCSRLTAITLPESVTSIGYSAFYNCSSLTDITIPEGVTSIESGAFSDCSSLTDIVVAEGNNVYDSRGDCNAIIESASNTLIAGCSTTIIPEGVTSIGRCAFTYCSSLTDITIPEGVRSIGYWAFHGCSSLNTIVLPKSVGDIWSEAFADCPELTDVYCYAESVPSTTTDAFDGSYPEYATLHVPAGAINSYKATAPWSSFGKIIALGASITEITLSESSATLLVEESLTLTATVAPDNATDKTLTWSSSNPSVATVDNMGKVTAIASGTTTITATANDGSGVSAQCEVTVTSTAKVEIDGIWYNLVSKAKQAEVTYKGNSYNSYSGEYSGSITIPATVTHNGVEYSVTSIGGSAFRDCSSLTTITLPESVTSIGSSAFSGCSSLTAITIPEGVTSIEFQAFWRCSSLTAITIPEGVTSIGLQAFWGCSSLTAINIPNGVTSIGQSAFSGCRKLTAINIPENSQLTSIGYEAFEGCSGLPSISIPEGVTSIGEYAFSSCNSLTTIVLPKSVGYISSKAFAGCPELTDVYCYAETVPATNADAFNGSYIEHATLHVPASAMNDYKTTAPWSSFGTIKTVENVTPEKCATPVISYVDGKVVFACDTDGAIVKSNIKENIAGDYNEMEVAFIPTYTLTAYATKENYEDSDVTTLTLCWIPCTEEHNGTPTNILSIPSKPVLISARDGVITLSGLADGTEVAVVTTGGTTVATATATNGTATLATNLTAGTIAIVKIGEHSIKVAIR